MVKNKKQFYIIGVIVFCCLSVCISSSMMSIFSSLSKPSVTNINSGTSKPSYSDSDSTKPSYSDSTSDNGTNQNGNINKKPNKSQDNLGNYEYEHTVPGKKPSSKKPTSGSGKPTSGKPSSSKSSLEVIAYDRKNFKKEIGKFKPGEYPDLSKTKYGNYKNDISSLKIPDGLEVHLFDKRNFKGEEWIFKKDTKDLGKASNDASSMKIIDIR